MDKILNSTKNDLKDNITKFNSGDTVSVGVKVTEGSRTRIQYFDGIVISISSLVMILVLLIPILLTHPRSPLSKLI